jgi:hypothetical protein
VLVDYKTSSSGTGYAVEWKKLNPRVSGARRTSSAASAGLNITDDDGTVRATLDLAGIRLYAMLSFE